MVLPRFRPGNQNGAALSDIKHGALQIENNRRLRPLYWAAAGTDRRPS
jgi:hypothetical protein